MTKRPFIAAWKKILMGKAPLLSIEITKECPLHCPGCYAYADRHLGGPVALRELNDLRGDDLVRGVIELVTKQDPLHVSIVGGEPLIRHRELNRILPELSRMGVPTLVVTSAVIPIPSSWQKITGLRVAVSIDGLREDHDTRRYPATYDRILKNIEGRRVDISWVITGQQMRRPGYLDEYLAFWTARREIDRIWLSTYTPQVGERSAEMLTAADRQELARLLPELKRKYPALLLIKGMEEALLVPPLILKSVCSRRCRSTTRPTSGHGSSPAFFGGNPDCNQCGCAISTSLHRIGQKKVAGPLTVNHIMKASAAVGSIVNRLIPDAPEGVRCRQAKVTKQTGAHRVAESEHTGDRRLIGQMNR